MKDADMTSDWNRCETEDDLNPRTTPSDTSVDLQYLFLGRAKLRKSQSKASNLSKRSQKSGTITVDKRCSIRSNRSFITVY